MDAVERDQYIQMLKETPDQLAAAVKGISKRLLLWAPAPGKWSILEIVCHMRDMERDAYLDRYQRILSEENPVLKNIDGDSYALERVYRRQKLSDALREWKQLRKQVLQLLRKAKGTEWQRPGVHETDGPFSLEIILRRQAIGNDQAHLAQIEHIKRRFDLLRKLEEGVKLVESALKGVPGEALRRRPASGKWSMLEILAHLAVTEQVFVTRYAQIAGSDRPALCSLDNDALAERLKFNEMDPVETAKEYKRLRLDALTLLRAVPQKGWQRVGIHPKRGEISIEGLLQIHSSHDAKHADQVRERRREFGVA